MRAGGRGQDRLPDTHRRPFEAVTPDPPLLSVALPATSSLGRAPGEPGTVCMWWAAEQSGQTPGTAFW